MRIRMTSSIRLLSCLFMVAALCLVAGCRESDSTTPDGTSTTAIPVFEDVDDDALREMIDDALHFTYTERQLTLDDNAAWQILHGALPFGMQFKVYNCIDSMKIGEHMFLHAIRSYEVI